MVNTTHSRPLLLAALIALALAPTTFAGEVAPLTTFTAGTPAKAAEVNGNFGALTSAVNDNHARLGGVETQAAALQAELNSARTTIETQAAQLALLAERLSALEANALPSALSGQLLVHDGNAWRATAPDDLSFIEKFQYGSDAPINLTWNPLRYMTWAMPQHVGTVIPLDNALVERLCKDRDGCNLTLMQLDGSSRVVNARTTRLFISMYDGIWRLADLDIGGTDGDGTASFFTAWSCTFTDAETSLGILNGMTDAASGFGLLNTSGYGCRLILED